MRIRTTLIISVAVFAVVLAIIAISLMLTNRRISNIDDNGIERAISVERGSGELNYIASDYLLYREEVKIERWHAKWTQVNSDLMDIDPPSSVDQASIENIQTSLLRLKEVFEDVSSADLASGSTSSADPLLPFIQTSWNRLAVQNQGLISDTASLIRHMHEERDDLRATNIQLIVVLLGGFSIFLVISYLIVQRRVLRSVAELHSGAEVIGSGNLDYRVDVKHFDEVGELATAFNKMTADLKHVTASKTALEQEIAKREAAQIALRETESNYRSLFENMIEGFVFHKVILDAAGRPADYLVLEVNPAFEQLIGLSSSEIKGKKLTELLPELGEHPGEWITEYGNIALDGRGRRFERYLETVGKWCSVAVYSPAREFLVAVFDDISERKQAEQRLLDRGATIQNYADRLSLLHDIGLTLNRETDKSKLLQTTLAGAARLTDAGVASMTLIKAGKIYLSSCFAAPWYQEKWGKCSLLPGNIQLTQYIEQILQDKDQVSLHFDELEELHNVLGLTEPHPELMRLLVNAIRDTRGNLRGFMALSHKSGQAGFTSGDEEIIGLLAGQSSVALTSIENYEREHMVASTLQDSLLPDVPLRKDLDIGIVYQSASGIARLGGDFYDFIELEDGRLAIAVGDVCGQGLEAATATAMLKYTLRAYLEEGLSGETCLRKLNKALNRQLAMEKFITLQLAILDVATGRMEYVSAGHPEPVLVFDGRIAPMEVRHSLPLGVIDDFEFIASEVEIDTGGSVLMFTDGLLEARPADGKPFGRERIEESVLEIHGSSSEDTVNYVMEKARQYSEGNLKDDIAVLMFSRM